MQTTGSNEDRGRALLVSNTGTYLRNVWLPLARALRGRGYDVVLAGPENEDATELRKQGFRYEEIRLPRGIGNPLKELRALADLFRLYRRERPNVVHNFTIKPILYGALAARLARVPTRISAVSGLGSLFARDGFWHRVAQRTVLQLYRLLLRGGNSWVLCQNPDDEDLFVGRGVLRPEQVVVTRGSGIDMSTFTPAPLPDEPVFLCAARILWDKGIGDYVEAARRVRRRHPEARFLLAGPLDPGQPTAIPEETVRHWHEEGVIEYLGFQRDMVGLIGRTSVVVLPTQYREGIPRILVEGAAMGRPVVTTDLPGCREACRAGVSGRLVPAGDTDALVEAMSDMLESRETLEEYGRRGREWAASQFDLTAVTDQILDVYSRATGSPPGRRTVRRSRAPEEHHTPVRRGAGTASPGISTRP